jgi:hypothetical protein
MAYSDLSAAQRTLLEQCVDSVAGAHGKCGVKLAEVNNQSVAGLVRRGLVRIEHRRGYERVLPTDDGVRIAQYLRVHRLDQLKRAESPEGSAPSTGTEVAS